MGKKWEEGRERKQKKKMGKIAIITKIEIINIEVIKIVVIKINVIKIKNSRGGGILVWGLFS